MTASAARRAASAPIPPQTTTTSPFSKKRKLRPPFSFSLQRQSLTRGRTSRSSAATTATLDISVVSKPCDCPAQCIFNRNDLPPQLACSLVGAGKHLLLPHAHCVDGSAWLAPQQPPGNGFIDDSSGKRKEIRQLDLR